MSNLWFESSKIFNNISFLSVRHCGSHRKFPIKLTNSLRTFGQYKRRNFSSFITKFIFPQRDLFCPETDVRVYRRILHSSKRSSCKPRLSHTKYMHIILFDKSHHSWLRWFRLMAGASGFAAIPGCPESGSMCFTWTYPVNVNPGFYSPNLQMVLEMFSLGKQKRVISKRTRCCLYAEVLYVSSASCQIK